jgi:hypothetical protein
VALAVSYFPSRVDRAKMIPGVGISFLTPVGKLPWARFEAEMA